MDFKRVISTVITDFRDEELRFALIGGFGMAALGIVRATNDIDFLLNKEDETAARRILLKYGYTEIYKSENVMQFSSGNTVMGTVDFVFAYRPISLEMISRSTLVSVFDGEFQLPVLLPDDIIGLKVQAMVNDPDRRQIDLTDIVLLMNEYSNSLEWERLESYFKLFKEDNLFRELRERYK